MIECAPCPLNLYAYGACFRPYPETVGGTHSLSHAEFEAFCLFHEQFHSRQINAYYYALGQSDVISNVDQDAIQCRSRFENGHDARKLP